MIVWIVAAALLAGAAPEPTYLTCFANETSGPLAVEVTLDEANQRAIVLITSTGRVVTRSAIFSPSDVRIPDDPSIWIVSRVDLSFHRLTAIGDKTWDDMGECKVKPAPAKRAF